jgi:hypothetical protein
LFSKENIVVALEAMQSAANVTDIKELGQSELSK